MVLPTSWRGAGGRLFDPGGRPGPGLPGFGAERRAMDAVRRERAFRSKMPLLAGPEMTVDDEVVMDKRVAGSGRMLYRTSDCGRISPGSGEAGLAQEISGQVLPVEVSRAGGLPPQYGWTSHHRRRFTDSCLPSTTGTADLRIHRRQRSRGRRRSAQVPSGSMIVDIALDITGARTTGTQPEPV